MQKRPEVPPKMAKVTTEKNTPGISFQTLLQATPKIWWKWPIPGWMSPGLGWSQRCVKLSAWIPVPQSGGPATRYWQHCC